MINRLAWRKPQCILIKESVVKAFIFSVALAILFASACLAADGKKKNSHGGGDAKIDKRVLEKRDPNDYVQIFIFLDEQELDLYVGDKVAVVSPVSTGRRPGWTPLGQYSIISKSAKHRSSTYGKHVTGSGKVSRSNVDSRKSKPAPGSRFVGSPMPNFLRLTQNGVGIHAGVLPGYPASHGCIRVPHGVSSLLFEHCSVGTRVTILQRRGETLTLTLHSPSPSPATAQMSTAAAERTPRH